MAIHNLKVYPDSKAEVELMRLFKLVKVKPELVICKLGSIFGTDYNEYIFSDGLYNQIKDELSKEGARA